MEKDDVESFELLRERNILWHAQNIFIPISISFAVVGGFHLFRLNLEYDAVTKLKIIVAFVIAWKIVIEGFLITRKLFCFQKVSNSFILVYQIKNASHIYITLCDEGRSSFILELQRSQKSNEMEYFMLYQVKYTYEPSNGKFSKLDFPVKTIQDYIDYKPLSEFEVEQNIDIYGRNKIEIICPPFSAVFKSKMFATSTIFNLFFVVLCVAEGYQSSIMVSVCALIFDILISCYNTYRKNAWVDKDSSELVPGDLVQIKREMHNKQFPCDLLVLHGSCVVDEAILTGESVPQIKESVETLEPKKQFCIESDGGLHVLFGGTTLLTVSPGEQHDHRQSHGVKFANACLAMVLKTGFYTNKV
ncbi:Manganese-transporting ATPase 13A1 [Thelohanellus kitauei]|uniref:Manganese-transporting ATPase 13A1 n=1 Tax=Thelohanellus kitauei TaxID=669202 RepID=A0A0C2IAN5_THEKT|nr:Manganese-transporting ATPase 13A1 [Thelohanellus kitauei]